MWGGCDATTPFDEKVPMSSSFKVAQTVVGCQRVVTGLGEPTCGVLDQGHTNPGEFVKENPPVSKIEAKYHPYCVHDGVKAHFASERIFS